MLVVMGTYHYTPCVCLFIPWLIFYSLFDSSVKNLLTFFDRLKQQPLKESVFCFSELQSYKQGRQVVLLKSSFIQSRKNLIHK